MSTIKSESIKLYLVKLNFCEQEEGKDTSRNRHLEFRSSIICYSENFFLLRTFDILKILLRASPSVARVKEFIVNSPDGLMRFTKRTGRVV